MLAIVAGVLVAIAAAVVLLSSGGGSSGSRGATTSAAKATTTSAGGTHSKTHHKTTSKTSSTAASRATNPAEASVAVLNGTETTGLAHRVSAALQQRGYSQATALSGRPAGAGQVSVVEYASGHQADAEGVARSLGVTKVQPMEAAVASLAASAKVVVIVGADKAATVP